MATMFPGIDSEELRRLLAQYQVTPEDRRQALGLGLLSGGLALAGARRGQEFNALAQAGLLGVGNYRGALNDARQSKIDAQKGALGSLQLQQAMQAARDDAGVREALGGMQAAPAPAAGMTSLAPTNANAATLQQRTAAANDPFTRYMQYADQLETAAIAQKNPKLSAAAEQYREKALKFRDENLGFETVMQDGKPTIVQRKKYGSPETLSGMLPKPDYKMVNTGKETMFYDPLLGQKGSSFAMQTTPGEDLSAQTAYRGQDITMRGQNMTDARSRDQNAIALGNRQIEQVHTIRKELNSLPDVQSYRAALPMLKSAQSAPNTRAGDLDVIYAVGKALDPGSVVREGELNLVIKSGNLPQQLVGATSYVMAGGKLPPDQRAELMAMLENRVGQLKQMHDVATMPYRQQAAAAGLPADQIFIEPPAAAGAGGASSAAPTLTPKATGNATARAMVNKVLATGDPAKIQELRALGYFK